MIRDVSPDGIETGFAAFAALADGVAAGHGLPAPWRSGANSQSIQVWTNS
ncbi:MAG: hypothetical protein M3Y27_23695 [Acidobacteriota bacterium]|nr:hypothetical protein [Acidobacteriota bacterium]